MSPRPAILIEIGVELIQPLRRKMADIFHHYRDDSNFLFSRQPNWDHRLKEIRLLDQSKASRDPLLPSLKKYLVIDDSIHPDQQDHAFYLLTKVDKYELVKLYDT